MRIRHIPLSFTVSPIFHHTCYLFPRSLRKPYIPFSDHSLTHASWLHYTPAKPSLWIGNPATHSTETSKAFALCLLYNQAKPHRGWASTALVTFQFKQYFFLFNKHVSLSREMCDYCWDQAKRETFGKTNTHTFSCWSLQWLHTECHVFCFSTCCLLSQRATTPQTHDRLIT